MASTRQRTTMTDPNPSRGNSPARDASPARAESVHPAPIQTRSAGRRAGWGLRSIISLLMLVVTTTVLVVILIAVLSVPAPGP